MRLETSLHTGTEALITQGNALNTIADNLANSNTVGFKDTRLEFADLLADGGNSLFGGPIQGGNGVYGQKVISQHSQQGTIESTGRGLDAAISGNGWFVVNDGTSNFYTRAGNFTTTPDGVLISPKGYKVMGYTAASPDTPVEINIGSISGTPTATTISKISGNLNAESTIGSPAGATTFQALSAASGGNKTTVSVVDSLGKPHDLSLYFFKSANQTWTAQAYADSLDTGGTGGTPVLVGTINLAFGPDGKPTNPTSSILNATPAWGNGASAGNVNIDLSGFTSQAGGTSISKLSTDGSKGGNVRSVSIDASGNVVGLLDSGETINAAQLALANFKSADGLQKLGDNIFAETDASGEAVIAKQDTKGLGKIKGESLESSTVDPAREFTTLIQYQQGYRASSQIIQSISELIKSTIQIA